MKLLFQKSYQAPNFLKNHSYISDVKADPSVKVVTSGFPGMPPGMGAMTGGPAGMMGGMAKMNPMNAFKPATPAGSQQAGGAKTRKKHKDILLFSFFCQLKILVQISHTDLLLM